MDWIIGCTLIALMVLVIFLLVRIGRKPSVPENGVLLEERTRALEQEKGRAEALQRELTAATGSARAQQALVEEWKQRVEQSAGELRAAQAVADGLKAELANARAALSGRDAQIEALQQQIAADREAQAHELQALHDKFNIEFQNLANKIFEEKAAKFKELNGESLKNLLDPLGSSLKEFREAVGHYNELSSKERTELGAQVKNLAELNKTLGTEAKNLTHALTAESQKQGRWGEVMLERLLEESGLVKDLNFFTQYQLTDAEGKPLKSMADEKMRPDAVVRLPDEHEVIIDAKCSLSAFLKATAEGTPDDARAAAFREHVASVRRHIDELSTKAYDDYRRSLNFVLMFIPSEAAYSAAIERDADLWRYAYDKRTLLVSPMTLLVSLRLIADLWKRENQAKHVEEIADRGAKLYDKFVGFAEVFAAMDRKITDLRTAYDDAGKRLTSGTGNLVWQAEKLRSLGIRTKKSAPASLLKDVDLGDVVPESSVLPAGK